MLTLVWRDFCDTLYSQLLWLLQCLLFVLQIIILNFSVCGWYINNSINNNNDIIMVIMLCTWKCFQLMTHTAYIRLCCNTVINQRNYMKRWGKLIWHFKFCEYSRTLKHHNGSTWTGLTWLRTVTSGGLLCTRRWTLRFRRKWGHFSNSRGTVKILKKKLFFEGC